MTLRYPQTVVSFLTLSTLIILSININNVGSSKILFYFGSSSFSHRVAVWPLVLKLAEKGHEITFLSQQPNKDQESALSYLSEGSTPIPNIIMFHPKSLVIYWKDKEGNKTRDMITSRVQGFNDGQGYWDGSMQSGLEICRVIFRSSEVQKWVEDSAFDLVVIDTPYNECALGLAYKLNAPYILFGTTSLYMWHQEMFGLPDESSWIPNFYYHFPNEMSFFQRLRNALTPIQWFYSTIRVSYIIPQLEQLMRKTLSMTDMPPLDELEGGASLFFLNTHFIQEYPRALPPFVIPVGGMHCTEGEKDMEGQGKQFPPDELSAFLDKYAEEGFIYISFGSLVEFSRAPKLVINKFVNAFTLLDLPVVWKWDDLDNIPRNKPEKVHMTKWLRQKELLGHPKLKSFITHGGALSYQEAICYGIPVVVMPLSPEEDYNAQIIERWMAGIRLDISYFTQYELTTSIKRVISDETFRNNMEKLSELFKDRPQKPTETAVWWTEYVLRHKNLTFAKSLALKQPWYQRRLLDVWGFLSLIVVGCLVVMVMSINYTFRTPPPQPKSVKHKHKVS